VFGSSDFLDRPCFSGQEKRSTKSHELNTKAAEALCLVAREMTRFMLKLLTFCLISLLIAFAPGSSDLAQTKCGGIQGRVTSSEGWLIPKASIQMIKKGVEKAVTIQTDDLGEYSSCLSPGIYEVFAKAPGYKGKKRSKIEVDESSKATIDFVMEHDGTVNIDRIHP
jgi:hypothetical protein